MELKRGDLKTKVKGYLTALVWKDEQNLNMHSSPLEGNFCDEHGKVVKPAIIQDCNRHVEYVDKSDHVTNIYSISRWIWKWTKSYSSFFWTLPFSTALSFSPLVVENYHTVITD